MPSLALTFFKAAHFIEPFTIFANLQCLPERPEIIAQSVDLPGCEVNVNVNQLLDQDTINQLGKPIHVLFLCFIQLLFSILYKCITRGSVSPIRDRNQ